MKRSKAAQEAHDALTQTARGSRKSRAIAFAKRLTPADMAHLIHSNSQAHSIAHGLLKSEEAHKRVEDCAGKIALANPDVVLAANPLWLSYVPPTAVTPDMARLAVSRDGGALASVPVGMRTPQLCAAALIVGHAMPDYRDRPIEDFIPSDARLKAEAIRQAAIQFALDAP